MALVNIQALRRGLWAHHIPLSEVGRVLGHTQASTTYRYVNANIETARRAAAALDAFNAEETLPAGAGRDGKLTKMNEEENDSLDADPEIEAQARAGILRLAQSQGDKLATSFGDLLGDGGSPDETADEMIQANREWRDAASSGSLDR